MTNRKWVTLHVVWNTVSSHYHIMNSLWVTLHILWKAVSSHIFLWPIACEWHCTFCEKHIFSYDQQEVSDIGHFVKGSLITSLPMTTVCEWQSCTFCERQSHQIFSYDQQRVNDIAHFVKGSLIRSFAMTNSLWVTLHILWKAVSSDLSPWPTACEWHCTFCERQSHQIFFYDQQQVSDNAHFVKGSLIRSFPMTNRELVTLHILWKQVPSDLFLWPTASEWHCTFCETLSHYIFSYGQQNVSGIAHFVKGSLIRSFLMTNSEWVTLHICERQSH